jgi:ABC-type uncharacterized transport system substrate-binding protein
MMKRRAFIAGLSGAAAAWPMAARGQSRKSPVVGVLWHAGSAEEEAVLLRPLVEGLAALGYVEGKTITIEHRFPAEQPERFKQMAAELAQLNPDVLVTVAPAASYAAKAATTTIPIVFVGVPDPVEGGLVKSLAHPLGNITGYALVDVSPKRLQLLKEAIPVISHVALLINPDNRKTAQRSIDAIQAAADPLGLTVQTVEVLGPHGFEHAFSQIPKGNKSGVITVLDPMFFNERKQMADVALGYRLPMMTTGDAYVKAGALMSYAPDYTDIMRRAGVSINKIIRGARPSDLPVEQPVKYDTTINLKTAQAIGVSFTPSVLSEINQAIE